MINLRIGSVNPALTERQYQQRDSKQRDKKLTHKSSEKSFKEILELELKNIK